MFEDRYELASCYDDNITNLSRLEFINSADLISTSHFLCRIKFMSAYDVLTPGLRVKFPTRINVKLTIMRRTFKTWRFIMQMAVHYFLNSDLHIFAPNK